MVPFLQLIAFPIYLMTTRPNPRGSLAVLLFPGLPLMTVVC